MYVPIVGDQVKYPLLIETFLRNYSEEFKKVSRSKPLRNENLLVWQSSYDSKLRPLNSKST